MNAADIIKSLGVERKVLLNPGPATTTDTVKLAQIVPDICPREEEFGQIMKDIQADLVKIVHGDPEKYTAVLFCGSGTINIDVCINSLLPADGKVLILNNGAYSARAAEICEAYGLPYTELKFPANEQPDLDAILAQIAILVCWLEINAVCLCLAKWLCHLM